MKTCTQALRFSQNLRGVRLHNTPSPAAERAQDCAASEEAAYQRGYRDGERALAEQLLRQRADLQVLEQGVLRSLVEAVPKVVQSCEAALTELTLELARKLVGGLPISAEMVGAVVREALADVDQSSKYTVYLNAEDLALLERVPSSLLTQKDPPLEFRASSEVTPGGCTIHTPFGTIDARREAKLEILRRSLAT